MSKVNQKSEKTTLTANRLMSENDLYRHEMDVTVTRDAEGCIDLQRVDAINYKKVAGGWQHTHTTDITTIIDEYGNIDALVNSFDWEEEYMNRNSEYGNDVFEDVAEMEN